MHKSCQPSPQPTFVGPKLHMVSLEESLAVPCNGAPHRAFGCVSNSYEAERRGLFTLGRALAASGNSKGCTLHLGISWSNSNCFIMGSSYLQPHLPENKVSTQSKFLGAPCYWPWPKVIGTWNGDAVSVYFPHWIPYNRVCKQLPFAPWLMDFSLCASVLGLMKGSRAKSVHLQSLISMHP